MVSSLTRLVVILCVGIFFVFTSTLPITVFSEDVQNLPGNADGSIGLGDTRDSQVVRAAPINPFEPLVGIPGVDTTDLNFGNYINALYLLSISLAAIFAVIKIIFAGVQYMFSDIVTQKGQAIKDIQGALFGLLIIIAAALVLNTINPTLTNLSTFENAGVGGLNFDNRIIRAQMNTREGFQFVLLECTDQCRTQALEGVTEGNSRACRIPPGSNRYDCVAQCAQCQEIPFGKCADLRTNLLQQQQPVIGCELPATNDNIPDDLRRASCTTQDCSEVINRCSEAAATNDSVCVCSVIREGDSRDQTTGDGLPSAICNWFVAPFGTMRYQFPDGIPLESARRTCVEDVSGLSDGLGFFSGAPAYVDQSIGTFRYGNGLTETDGSSCEVLLPVDFDAYNSIRENEVAVVCKQGDASNVNNNLQQSCESGGALLGGWCGVDLPPGNYRYVPATSGEDDGFGAICIFTPECEPDERLVQDEGGDYACEGFDGPVDSDGDGISNVDEFVAEGILFPTEDFLREAMFNSFFGLQNSSEICAPLGICGGGYSIEEIETRVLGTFAATPQEIEDNVISIDEISSGLSRSCIENGGTDIVQTTDFVQGQERIQFFCVNNN